MLALALQQATSPFAEIGGTIVPLVLMMGVAWLILIRPAQKQRKEQEEMRGAIKAGDEVLTIGGIFGVVTKLRDDRVHVKVADGVQVELSRNAISSVVTKQERE